MDEANGYTNITPTPYLSSEPGSGADPLTSPVAPLAGKPHADLGSGLCGGWYDSAARAEEVLGLDVPDLDLANRQGRAGVGVQRNDSWR